MLGYGGSVLVDVALKRRWGCVAEVAGDLLLLLEFSTFNVLSRTFPAEG